MNHAAQVQLPKTIRPLDPFSIAHLGSGAVRSPGEEPLGGIPPRGAKSLRARKGRKDGC